jgi:nitroreductase
MSPLHRAGEIMTDSTPPILPPHQLLHALQWRYAVQKFDDRRKIPDDIWSALEQALVLTPSSFGLQPWKFFVVTNQAVKEKLMAASFNQAQVAQASHVLVMASLKNPDVSVVDRHLQRMADVRKVPLASLDKLKNALTKFLQHAPARMDLNVWAQKQVYIVLGNFMASAAVLGVDTCPMEGFDPAKIDEILGLSEQGYNVVVMAVAGYRSPDDQHASHPKVRHKHEDVLARVS